MFNSHFFRMAALTATSFLPLLAQTQEDIPFPKTKWAEASLEAALSRGRSVRAHLKTCLDDATKHYKPVFVGSDSPGLGVVKFETSVKTDTGENKYQDRMTCSLDHETASVVIQLDRNKHDISAYRGPKLMVAATPGDDTSGATIFSELTMGRETAKYDPSEYQKNAAPLSGSTASKYRELLTQALTAAFPIWRNMQEAAQKREDYFNAKEKEQEGKAAKKVQKFLEHLTQN